MTLKDDIDELKKIIIEGKEKEKKFKFPFGKKVGRSQRGKNYVTVILVNENGVIDFKKYQIEQQTIMHDLIPRLATAGHVLWDKKGNPVIILPNWSVEPFSPLDHYQKSLLNGSNSKGYKILMARMQSERVEGKKKMPGWLPWVLGLILVGIIVFAIVTGGNKTPVTGVVK
jgi:hypothetical protein